MFLDWWTPIENLPALLKGALVSLELTLTVFALSLFFGTIVGFLRYNKHHKAGYRIATVYVELIRNTPMLVQIFFLYFGLPQFKIYLPALFAGCARSTFLAKILNIFGKIFWENRSLK